MSHRSHDRYGPFPYREIGDHKYWNPTDEDQMFEIFSDIHNYGCDMSERPRKNAGDVLVISDGSWQTYGIYTKKRRGPMDKDYKIVKKKLTEKFGYLQVGDVYFGFGKCNSLAWVKGGVNEDE